MEKQIQQSVRAVLVDPEGKVLVVKPTKPIRSADGKYELLWSWPGGKIEAGESPEEAVIREVMEETGYEVEVITKIGEREHPTYPAYIHYFACWPIGSSVKEFPNEEIAAMKWVTIDEAGELFDQEVYSPITEYLKLISES